MARRILSITKLLSHRFNTTNAAAFGSDPPLRTFSKTIIRNKVSGRDCPSHAAGGGGDSLKPFFLFVAAFNLLTYSGMGLYLYYDYQDTLTAINMRMDRMWEMRQDYVNFPDHGLAEVVTKED